jgi:hypothetical protein
LDFVNKNEWIDFDEDQGEERLIYLMFFQDRRTKKWAEGHCCDRCDSIFKMKRRDDNRQLRPDEVDALEDETEEPGVFERASADVIAARRIIKPKR